MPNPYHLEMVRQGAEVWNQWRNDSQVGCPELSGADLSEIDLTSYCLAGANLSEANLSRANLSSTDLTGSNLSMAYLIETNLFRANLSEAHLTRANLAKANLFAADLTDAVLSDANLSGANLSMTDLTRTNMTKVNLSLANFTKTYFRDTIGMPHGVYGVESSSSVPVLTPAIVHQRRDLITREMLGGLKNVKQSHPIQVQISIQGHTDFYDERTLMNTVLDVMKIIGFDPTENPKISEGAFCATIACQGRGDCSPDRAKETVSNLQEELLRVLEKNGSSSTLTNQQVQVLEKLIETIQSLPNQLAIRIENLVLLQSKQCNKTHVYIHQISDRLKQELIDNRKILSSSLSLYDRVKAGVALGEARLTDDFGSYLGIFQ